MLSKTSLRCTIPVCSIRGIILWTVLSWTKNHKELVRMDETSLCSSGLKSLLNHYADYHDYIIIRLLKPQAQGEVTH